MLIYHKLFLMSVRRQIQYVPPRYYKEGWGTCDACGAGKYEAEPIQTSRSSSKFTNRVELIRYMLNLLAMRSRIGVDSMFLKHRYQGARGVVLID